MSELRLLVYVVHWNAVDWCTAAVSSLLASTGAVLQVTVLDNSASADELRRRLPPDTEVVPMAHNLGYAGAANVGLRRWRRDMPEAPYALVCSHDVTVDPACVAALVGAADAHPGYGVLGPRLTAPTGSCGGAWDGRRSWHLGCEADDERPVIDRQWVSGTCLLLRGSCVDEVGGFDERLHSYLEDVDLGLRCRDRGWGVGVVPNAVAAGMGTAASDYHSLIVRNSVRLAAKRGGTRAGFSSVLHFCGREMRSLGGAAWPLRTGPERASSWAEFRATARGLAGLLGPYRRRGPGRR